MSSIGSTLPYELHLFGRLWATQKVTKTNRIIFWLFLHSNSEYAYHYHFIIYINKAMCLPHVSTTDNTIPFGPVCIYRYEMIMICILPIRVKEQPI